MGVMQRLRRLQYVYGWRLRYWWLDTRAGRQAHLAVFFIALLVVVVQLARITSAAVTPRPPGTPAEAVYWWVVQLVILVVSAAVSYAMRPKPEAPQPQDGAAPTVEDGQAVRDYFGTCWIENEFLLAWKIVGRDPVRSRGGKK